MDRKENSLPKEMRRLIDLVRRGNQPKIEYLDEVYLTIGEESFLFQEGKWVSGRFDQNIRIDQANYGAGQRHAHVYGRKGNELGVVNVNGTGSHGSMFKLHAADAKALSAHGFQIRSDGLVEWISLHLTDVRFLLEG